MSTAVAEGEPRGAPAARASGGWAGTESPSAFALRSPVPVLSRTYVVRGWPRGASGIWAGALSAPVAFRVRWTAAPSSFRWSWSQEARLRRVLSSVAERAGSDAAAAPRPEEVGVAAAIRRLRDAVLYRGERVVDVWCYVTVLSDSPEQLEADAGRVRAELEARGLELEEVRFGHAPGFAATLPVGDTGLAGLRWWPPRTGVAGAAARVAPADFGRAGDPAGIYAGHDTWDRRPVYLDFRHEADEVNTNAVVVGASGEGKSTWLKAVAVTGALLDGWRVLVLDVDGEYRALCQRLGGVFVDLSGTSGRYPDPCRFPTRTGDPADDAGRYDRLLGAVGGVFAVLLGPAAGELERVAVEQAAAELLAEAGVVRDRPETWPDGEPPAGFSLRDVYRRVALMAASGYAAAARAAPLLWRYFEGSLAGMFADPLPLPTMPAPLTVLHLGNPVTSEADAGALAVKYQLALGAVWEWLRQGRAAGRWTMVVVDEGQRVFAHPLLARNLAALATTIRKWRGSLVLATNTPGALWESGHGEALWGNALYKVVFALEEDQVGALARHAAVPDGVLEAVRAQLHTRRAVIRDGGRGWVQVRLDLPPEELELYRTRR